MAARTVNSLSRGNATGHRAAWQQGQTLAAPGSRALRDRRDGVKTRSPRSA